MDTGLTTNAKVGIGVGVSLGVLFIIGLIIIAFCIGRRKRRLAHKSTNQHHSDNTTGKYQIHDGQAPWGNMKGMLPAELEEQRRHAELHGQRSPIELMS